MNAAASLCAVADVIPFGRRFPGVPPYQALAETFASRGLVRILALARAFGAHWSESRMCIMCALAASAGSVADVQLIRGWKSVWPPAETARQFAMALQSGNLQLADWLRAQLDDKTLVMHAGPIVWHHVARGGHIPAAKLAIQMFGHDGMKPEDTVPAAAGGHENMLSWMMSWLQYTKGSTPASVARDVSRHCIEIAAFNGHGSIVDALLDRNSYSHAKETDSAVAAIIGNHFDLAERLMARLPNAGDCVGQALLRAVKCENWTAIRYLEQKHGVIQYLEQKHGTMLGMSCCGAAMSVNDRGIFDYVMAKAIPGIKAFGDPRLVREFANDLFRKAILRGNILVMRIMHSLGATLTSFDARMVGANRQEVFRELVRMGLHTVCTSDGSAALYKELVYKPRY